MKGLLLRKSFITLTFLLSCFPLLPYGIRSVVTLTWAIIGLFCFLIKDANSNKIDKINRKDIYLLGITIFPFLIITFSLTYSDNITEGVNKLIKMLSLIVFPLIFFLNLRIFSKEKIKNIFYVFTLSVTILVLYQIIISLIHLDYLTSDLSIHEIKRNNLIDNAKLDSDIINKIKLRRFRNFVTEKANTHTTFQGLWIVFALLIIIRKFFESKTKILMQVILAIIFIALFSWLLALSTRMPLLSFFIAIMSALIVLRRYSVKFYVLSAICLFIISLACYNYIPSIKIRIDEVVNTKFILPSKDNNIQTYNSTNVRNGIYYCSWDIIKGNLFYGVGIGDMQDQLNSCYNSKIGAKIYLWKDYNSHNQFLFFLISTGLIGFIGFCASFVYQFKVAINYNSFLYFYFSVIVVLISLTENILVRSDGVLFFSFFNSLILFNIDRKYDNN